MYARRNHGAAEFRDVRKHLGFFFFFVIFIYLFMIDINMDSIDCPTEAGGIMD